jgi:phage replication-related protein YjqB (UPF0714/DUF867 family)
VSKDKYFTFAELAAGEDPSAYRIVSMPRGSAVAIIAPHGGNIEPGTSELARAVAGQELSLYLFEGRLASTRVSTRGGVRSYAPLVLFFLKRP